MTSTQGTVLKGHSFRKVENHGSVGYAQRWGWDEQSTLHSGSVLAETGFDEDDKDIMAIVDESTEI